MALRILYVMDPMTRVLADKDTTFAFQLEGQRRGHEQYHCGPQDLFVDRAVPHTTARRVTVERATPHFRLDEARITPLTAFDVVFMRKDPPFDMAYVFALALLALVDRVRHVRPERSARARERQREALRAQLSGGHSGERRHVGCDAAEGFMEALGGEMIVKPLDGCGGPACSTSTAATGT
jgi:glutathione synthase